MTLTPTINIRDLLPPVSVREVLLPLRCDDCGGPPDEEVAATYEFAILPKRILIQLCPRHLALRYAAVLMEEEQ